MKKFLFILIGFSLLVSGCGKKDKITYDPVDRKAHEQLIVDFYNYCANNSDVKMCEDLWVDTLTSIKVIEPILEYTNTFGFLCGYYETNSSCYNVISIHSKKSKISNIFIVTGDNEIKRSYYDSDQKKTITEYWSP